MRIEAEQGDGDNRLFALIAPKNLIYWIAGFCVADFGFVVFKWRFSERSVNHKLYSSKTVSLRVRYICACGV